MTAPSDDETEVDQYGNPVDGSSLPFCCFPDCGCDGARLCMAKSGASGVAMSLNLERLDCAALRALVAGKRGGAK